MSFLDDLPYNPWAAPSDSSARRAAEQQHAARLRAGAEKPVAQAAAKQSAASAMNSSIVDAAGPFEADMYVTVSITGPAGIGKTYLAEKINALIEEMRREAPMRTIRSIISQTSRHSRDSGVGDKVVRRFNPPMLDSLVDGAINEGLKASEQRAYFYGVDLAAPAEPQPPGFEQDPPPHEPAISRVDALNLASWLLPENDRKTGRSNAVRTLTTLIERLAQ